MLLNNCSNIVRSGQITIAYFPFFFPAYYIHSILTFTKRSKRLNLCLLQHEKLPKENPKSQSENGRKTNKQAKKFERFLKSIFIFHLIPLLSQFRRFRRRTKNYRVIIANRLFSLTLYFLTTSKFIAESFPSLFLFGASLQIRAPKQLLLALLTTAKMFQM